MLHMFLLLPLACIGGKWKLREFSSHQYGGEMALWLMCRVRKKKKSHLWPKPTVCLGGCLEAEWINLLSVSGPIAFSPATLAKARGFILVRGGTLAAGHHRGESKCNAVLLAKSLGSTEKTCFPHKNIFSPFSCSFILMRNYRTTLIKLSLRQR